MIKFIFKIHSIFLFKIIYFLILFFLLIKIFFKNSYFRAISKFFYLYNSLYYDFKKRYFKMSVFSRF